MNKYLLFLAFLLMTSCGGGSSNQNNNISPLVDAGSNQNIEAGNIVNLIGSASDSDGNISSYIWKQVAGTIVPLLERDSISANFTTNKNFSSENLTFTLTVTDNDGASSTDSIIVTILPHSDSTSNLIWGDGKWGKNIFNQKN